MKTLGQVIRELRDKKDLSLRDLAKLLDISAAFLSDIELGRRYPSEKILKSIADRLDISVKELQKYDTRAPIDDIRRLVNSEPLYGVAFRQVIDKQISPEDLMGLVKRKTKGKNK